MKFVVVIPARYASSRLPGKPLINILGKNLLQRTWEQCVKAVDKSLVYVATDDERILNYCNSNGIQVEMTSSSCLTGTDRISEFADKIDADYYINVQGDEPLINPDDIVKMVNSIDQFKGEIINGYTEISSVEDFNSLSIPKVVFSPQEKLLYMSRSPIPGNKTGSLIKSWKQVCIYAFPRQALKEFCTMITKTPLEQIEDIEILRFLEMGMDVRMVKLSSYSIAVDNPDDLIKVEKVLIDRYNGV